MKLFNAIKSIHKEHWITASWLLGYAVIIGAGPMWINLIIKSFYGSVDLNFLIYNGQAVVFSAALISSGFYFVAKDFKKPVFPGRIGFILLLVLIWALVFSVFTFISLCNSLKISIPTINWEIIRLWSIGLAITSLIIVYIAAAINEHRMEEHYKPQIYDTGTGKLEEDFDRSGGAS